MVGCVRENLIMVAQREVVKFPWVCQILFKTRCLPSCSCGVGWAAHVVRGKSSVGPIRVVIRTDSTWSQVLLGLNMCVGGISLMHPGLGSRVRICCAG